MANFGIFPQGNLPQNPDGTGSWFPTGLRVGQAFTSSIDPGSGQPITGNPTMTRWGGGILLSPNYTHNISVAPPPDTEVDICVISHGQPSGYQPLLYVGDQNVSTTWGAICANGLQGLQLDWPRSYEVKITGTQTAPISIYVFGYDWYGQPMQQKSGDLSNTTGSAKYYTPVERTLNSELSPNKAFYQITKVYMSGTAEPGVTVNVQTCASFGLPFALSPTKGMAVQVQWNGVIDLGVVGSGILYADATLPSAKTNDVRGTYVPSTDPITANTNRLVFQYYIYGGDAAINVWADEGLPDWSVSRLASPPVPASVPYLVEEDIYGRNQYYRDTPG